MTDLAPRAPLSNCPEGQERARCCGQFYLNAAHVRARPRQDPTASAANSTPIQPPTVPPSAQHWQAHKIGSLDRCNQAKDRLGSEMLRRSGRGDRPPPFTGTSTRTRPPVSIIDGSTSVGPPGVASPWPDLPPWPPRDEIQDNKGHRGALMRLHRLEREQRG